jgi:hypothetical protein
MKSIKISLSNFPLGEAAKYPFDYIEVTPLNFQELVYHLRYYPENNNEYQKFITHYSTLKIKVSHAQDLMLPDLYYAMFLLYGLSINQDLEVRINYTCNSCDAPNTCSISPSDIRIIKYEEPCFDVSLSQGTLRFCFPTGKHIETYLPKLMARGRSRYYDLDTSLLIISAETYLRNPYETEMLIAGATHSDALKLMNLLRHMQGPVQPHEAKCRTCGMVNVIDYFYTFREDFFRIFFENNGITETQDVSKSKGNIPGGELHAS